MEKLLIGVSTAALSVGVAQAGGIDRSGLDISVLFEKGNVAELRYSHSAPSLSGKDVAMFGGGSSGNIATDYSQVALSYKADISEKLSYAIILDQPFGVDLTYGPGSVALGGTRVYADTAALTGVVRYKFDENWSAHGGVRINQASGEIGLKGLAYGPFSGYKVQLSDDIGYGYLVGVAYEKPEIALRVALTYNSKIRHSFDTVETMSGAVVGTSPTDVSLPQSINLDFQTGVSENTLIFGGIRWAEWSEFFIDPFVVTTMANGGTFVKGGGLIQLEDVTTYTVGVGHQFTENWGGAASVNYEGKGSPLTSPLNPTNGRLGMTLAAVYTQPNMKITTGVNYTKFGDSMPRTIGVGRSDFTGNDIVSVGVKVGFGF